MRLPTDATRLGSVRDWPSWKRAVEHALVRLDARMAAAAPTTGAIIAYAGVGLPAGMVAANGAVVARADYPRLFARIGTAYNTGGETGTDFRLPNLATPPPVGVWVILT